MVAVGRRFQCEARRRRDRGIEPRGAAKFHKPRFVVEKEVEHAHKERAVAETLPQILGVTPVTRSKASSFAGSPAMKATACSATASALS